MIEQYKLSDALKHIIFALYLAEQADERGLSHGEKHHILQVLIAEIRKTVQCLDTLNRDIERQVNKGLPELSSDIPY